MSLEARLETIVRASPTLMTVLEGLRDLDFPQWRLVSGAVYQTVWNDLTGRAPDHGLRDYDAMYFDPDTTWDAEDAFIRTAAAAFPEPLSQMVEVRNQARVHLWFEGKFGEPYAPLTCTDEAVERFLAPAFAVGVRLEKGGRLDILAPFGLEDCFAMRLRPNPRRLVNDRNLPKVAGKLMTRWPELTLEL
ncbi:MAG: hypothetical protein B7Y99_12815 [Caulobacterales bacterium 32-69-10]|nr:MAG: hypothetical protein B7Y99_12815 [Caulobacterales bacterium 32-69-10]